jgi:hypothetical protein
MEFNNMPFDKFTLDKLDFDIETFRLKNRAKNINDQLPPTKTSAMEPTSQTG